ncbi:hypothetical protein HD806DRAFT_456639 [Xylariaceae sp. AK1471]|nr:hypothetical protein HD806DRAFT_456639 [Xylariaceae sp. AK1471]
MLCFGVPNLGLRHDQLRTIVQDNPNEALVHSLIVDNDAEPSEYLRRISNEFSRVCTGYKYKVVNFFERNPTSTVQILEDGTLNRAGPKSLLVTKESATKIGLVAAAEEDNVSFDADHSALVKFESKDHEDYIIVKTRLCKLIEDSREVVANRFLEHSVRQPTSKSTDSCLQSLAFLEMNSRCHDIDTAHPGTCTWLENHPSFKDWESLPRALLWIRGKPGSGKSTLLKYTLAKTQREAQDPEVKVLVLSFFFNARGVELEKTLLGFYRCLSHQLLDKFPGALPDLVNRYAKQEKIFGPVGERWRWHEDELRDFLKTSLPEILELSSVTLFVDALDECGDDHARKLIGHLKDLLETLPKTTYNLRICVSCRHYPTLELGNGPNHGRTISVEHQNTADIGKYVRESLQNLDHQESIASLITSSARGVFLWAYLVVIQVLKLQLSGRGHRAMVQGIKKIPKDLDELYCKLLEDLTEDRTERETTLRLVQWICFAQRPLSTNELRWAVMIDPDNSHETLDEYRRSEVFIEDGNITTRINALSCGLAEVTPSGRVQFIHQSVKDFFNDHGLTTLTGRSSRANLIEANYCLARSCIRYMAMEEISKVESWAREKRDEKWYEKQYEKRHKIRQHREPKWNLDPVEESWELDVPLLQYAVSEWVKHAKATQGAEEVIPVDYLFGILSRPLNRLVDRWVALHQAIVGDYNQPEVGSTLLHVAAIYGLTDTLSAILVKPGVGKEDTDAKDENGRTPLMLAARYAHEAVVQGLLNAGADVKVRDRYGNTPLHFAAEHGNEAITQLLLTAKAEVNSQDASNRTPLYQAVGYEAVVNLLLSADADVNTRAYNGETPLFGAIRLREEATVWALLNAKAEVNLKDDEGNTPLT